MREYFHKLTKSRHSNQPDIIRVSMAIMVFLLPVILVWGVVMYTIAFLYEKSFDINSAFTAILAFCAGTGTFLMSGAAGIYFKHQSEPDGSHIDTVKIVKGEGNAK